MTKRILGRTGFASVAIAIAVVAAVTIFLNTGDITVNFEASALTIKASYWADFDIRYAEIDTVAYRRDVDVGERTVGIGSAKLSAGSFQNEEFGAYTLYACANATEFIVLTAHTQTIVIGLSSKKEAETIYKTLTERMAN